MQKTILEHLQDINDPVVRERAIANAKNKPYYQNGDTVRYLSWALKWAFFWEDAPEGRDYWQQAYDTIKEHGNYPAPAPSEEGEVDKWVSVKDRLPESGGYYMCYDSNFKLADRYYFNDGIFREDKGKFALADGIISHWQPLPNPPIQ